jgi:pyridoxine 4-dehydrogenase
MTNTMTTNAGAAGTINIGGDLDATRLGFGTMRLTGVGIWGPPADPDEAVRVLRRAVELGVTFIDTADSYGPYIAEQFIHEALHPYPDDVVIATKAGFLRTGPDVWVPLGNPSYLRQEVEMSLRRLSVERVDLLQLHRVDPNFSIDDQVGVLADMKAEGKIRHVGLSEVNVEQLKAAQAITTIVSVQNLYNLANRDANLSSTKLRRKASRSFRGSRWLPARSPPATARYASWPSITPRLRHNWRWHGCSNGRR